MITKELGRFTYEGFEYHISHSIYKNGYLKVSLPGILVTTKSSNKNRNGYNNKDDGHYKLIGLKSPIKLIRKVYNILNNELKNFDYVCFYHYKDDSDKRGEVYTTLLNKMGFIKLWSNKDYYFYSREDKKIKRKEINNILWKMYHEM